jgi:hypothetical protein
MDNNPSVILFSVIALEKFAQTSKYMLYEFSKTEQFLLCNDAVSTPEIMYHWVKQTDASYFKVLFPPDTSE